MCGYRVGGRGSGPPEKLQNIGFLSNSGPDPLKNHEAIKPAFNVGASPSRQRNAINGVTLAAQLMALRWRPNYGPRTVVFGSSHPSSTKKK